MKGKIKPIRNDDDYHEALNFAEKLISADPSKNTDEFDQLSILATLIESYEKEHFPLDIPTAVDAIKFRMEQLNLKPSDLIPYLGSASRVSEILSQKRQLTVSMINTLSSGLNIPEKALLKKNENENEYSKNIPTPVYKQMVRRGYLDSNTTDKATALQKFFSVLPLQPSALYRKSKFRTDSSTNYYILIAWSNMILKKARDIQVAHEYIDGIITLEYLRKIAKLSIDEKEGPQKAIDCLKKSGIKVVIEPALNGANVDGVTILEDKNHPIIGLSLRHDRLDNFWFTLMHELSHISKHYNLEEAFIYDDFDSRQDKLLEVEKEADALASEALVDTKKWLSSPARNIPSPLTAAALAKELGVHIAIIAGKARHETGNWKYLSKLVSQYTIRDKFKEIQW